MTSSDIVTRFKDAMRAASAANVPLPWSRSEFTTFVELVQGNSNEAGGAITANSLVPKQFTAALNVFEKT